MRNKAFMLLSVLYGVIEFIMVCVYNDVTTHINECYIKTIWFYLTFIFHWALIVYPLTRWNPIVFKWKSILSFNNIGDTESTIYFLHYNKCQFKHVV